MILFLEGIRNRGPRRCIRMPCALIQELPIEREAQYLFLSEPIRERLLEPLVISPERHFAAKQQAEGCVLASDLTAAGDPGLERDHWRRHVRECVEALLPALEFVSLPCSWEGFYDVTPLTTRQSSARCVRGSRSPRASAATASCSRLRSAGSSPR
jgi:hypothetical protein